MRTSTSFPPFSRQVAVEDDPQPAVEVLPADRNRRRPWGVPEQAPEEAARLPGWKKPCWPGWQPMPPCARGGLPVGDALETFNDVAGKITWRLDRGHMRIASEQAMASDTSAGNEENNLLPNFVGGSGLLRLLSPECSKMKKSPAQACLCSPTQQAALR